MDDRDETTIRAYVNIRRSDVPITGTVVEDVGKFSLTIR